MNPTNKDKELPKRFFVGFIDDFIVLTMIFNNSFKNIFCCLQDSLLNSLSNISIQQLFNNEYDNGYSSLKFNET